VLIVGHITRDLIADGGWRTGGAALYAARTASLRGLRVAVVTSATLDVAAAARSALPSVALHIISSAESTTFENSYNNGARRQYLRALAAPIHARDIPAAWRDAPVALLAPVAADFRPSIARALRCGSLGLAPQGWLRAWDASGLVRPRALSAGATALLASCSVVVVSREDLAVLNPTLPGSARVDETLQAWAARTRYLVVTCGRDGAELWCEDRVERYPSFPAREVDPTGAGDVFAMTMLCTLAASGSTARAMIESNQVAALSVEGWGAEAIRSPDDARARFSER
jgi:sugar/nucleoside kinase (ribokinase family)